MVEVNEPLQYVSDDDLTDEQKTVIESTVDWVLGKPEVMGGIGNRQYITIGGLAGTGKTVVGQKIRDRLNEHCKLATCAFMGRAVAVLRSKGITDACTLHSLMYEVDEDSEGNLVFHKKEFIEPDVVLVDEASTINTSLHQDLLSYGVKVVYIGDHGQLEPIGDNPRLMVEPDLLLEQIHRNAGHIAEFAHKLRTPSSIFPFVRNEQVFVSNREYFLESMLRADICIVGFNKTRHAVNKALREDRGFTGSLPQVGEKIICLQNNRKWNVFNGLILQITKIVRTTSQYHIVNAEDETGQKWLGLPTLIRQYNNNSLNNERLGRNTLLFDYAYCLTCHRGQGGQWGKVAVLEEVHRGWDYTKWSYTAASRAYHGLIWCR